MRIPAPCLVLIACLLPWLALGQSRISPWREYRTADGLADAFCTMVTMNPRGVVLVRHGNGGLSRIDGYSVTNLPPPAGLFRVHEDRFGQIWALHERGLQTLVRGQWEVHPVVDVRAELQTNLLRRQRYASLLPVVRDRVLVLLSDKLLLYEGDIRRLTLLRRSDEMAIGRFNEIVAARDGGVIIAGSRGLARISGPLTDVRPASLWEEFVLPEWGKGLNLVRPQEGDDGSVAVLGESEGDASRRVLLLTGQEWRSLPDTREGVRMAWPGQDGALWLYLANGLFRVQLREPSVLTPMDSPEARLIDAAAAGNGVFWLATPEGVFRYSPPLWRVPVAVESRPLATHAAANGRDGSLWFVQSSGLLRRDPAGWKPFPFTNGAKIFTLFNPREDMWPTPDGDVLLDVDGGVQRLRVDELRTTPFTTPDGEPLHLLGPRGRDETFVLTGSWAAGTSRINATDGTTFTDPLPEPPPRRIGEPQVVFASRAGDIWVGGLSGVAVWADQKWSEPDPNYSPEKGACFGETSEGRIWCGAGDKLWETDGREWRVLRTGLERVNCILRASDGTMWVGTSTGLFRYREDRWIQHGVDEGLPGDTVYSLAETPDGKLWAGTLRGLACYAAINDADPPRSTIVSPTTERSPIGTSTMEAKLLGLDRWRQTPASRLLFEHRLNDGPWSGFTPETVVSLFNLNAGDYRLEVRAMDRNGNVDPRPASYEFVVVPPWFEDPRLMAIGALGVVAAGFFAVLAWNRHRRLVHSYAEVEELVNVRTEQLARANDQLLHSQKMNALGTLAAGVAHDFNNILSIIKGSAQIIQKNPSDTIKIRTRADRLVLVADQGAEIVRALLGFSRTAERDLVRCSLNEVVQDTLRLFGENFLKQIEVEFEPAPGLPEIVCPKGQLQQMLLNIVLNAADAMNGQGRLIIRVELSHNPPEGTVLAPAPAENYMTVSVRDFGIGIPPEVLPRIFEPFFTTKSLSQRRGTGLGLSMVYRTAIENGFGLAVETVLNEGTTLSITVPQPVDSGAPSQPAAPPAPA
jgi:signal transduction histidine kinase